MKRIFSLLLALSMLLTALPAFGEGMELDHEDILPAAEEETHLNVANPTRVSGAFFTAQFGNNTSDIDVRYMLHGYNPIAWSTQLDFILDPMVVSDMTTSQDADGNTVYTFKLCDDLYWNDGTALTAADYVFGILLTVSPEFSAIGADTDVWQHLVGYEDYASGASASFSGVHLVDDATFQLTVKSSYLPYFYEYAQLSAYPYPMDVLAPGCTIEETENGASISGNFTAEKLAEIVLDPETGYLSHPMKTCGPYSLVSYDHAAGVLEFRKNPYYKGNYQGAQPQITTVTLMPVAQEEAAQKLLSGELDLINKAVKGDALVEMSALTWQGFETEIYPRLGYGFVSFACEQGPQQSQAVRQALACLVDTDTFTEEYLKGYGMTVDGYYGIGQWMTLAAMGSLRPAEMTEEESAAWDELTLDNLDHYAYDPDRALKLIVDDGWTLNENGEAFDPEKDTLRYKDENGTLVPLSFIFGLTENNIAADMVLAMLQDGFETIGAQVTVETAPFIEILDDYFTEDGVRKYDLSFLATNFVSQFDVVTDFWFDENGPGTQNISKIQDEELLERAWKAHLTPRGDLLGFLANWISFQERFNEILPTLPIYSNLYMDCFTSRLHGYDANAEVNWPTALLNSYLTDEADEAEEEPTFSFSWE